MTQTQASLFDYNETFVIVPTLQFFLQLCLPKCAFLGGEGNLMRGVWFTKRREQRFISKKLFVCVGTSCVQTKRHLYLHMFYRITRPLISLSVTAGRTSRTSRHGSQTCFGFSIYAWGSIVCFTNATRTGSDGDDSEQFLSCFICCSQQFILLL